MAQESWRTLLQPTKKKEKRLGVGGPKEEEEIRNDVTWGCPKTANSGMGKGEGRGGRKGRGVARVFRD